MPDRVAVRVRVLEDGQSCDAVQVSMQGRLLELELTGENWSPGSLLEIERGTMFFWGELQQWNGTTATVAIEHSLDSARLQSVREIWGE